MKLLVNNPSTWKTTISFLFLSTLLILFIGWLTISGILPIDRAIDYSSEQVNFLKVWMTTAIFVGVLLPAIALGIWICHPKPRKVLGFYLLVLIVQIVTERVLSGVLFSSIAVPIGTINCSFSPLAIVAGSKASSCWHSNYRA